jgi:hypothetical protein
LADSAEPLGRARVRSLLERAERELQSIFSPSRVLDVVHADLMRLERSYG